MNGKKAGLETRSGVSEQLRKQNDSYHHAQVQPPRDEGRRRETQLCPESRKASAELNTTQKTLCGSNSRWQGIHGKPI